MFLYDSKIKLSLINNLIRELKNIFGTSPDMVRAKLRCFKDSSHLIIRNNTNKTKVILTFVNKQPDSFRAVVYEREANTAFNLSIDYVEFETIVFSKKPTVKEIIDKITPGLLRKSKYVQWITAGNFTHVKATTKEPNTLFENEVFAGKIIQTVLSSGVFQVTCEMSNNQTRDFILTKQQIPYIVKYFTPTKTLDNQFLVINRRMEHAIFDERNFNELFKFN